MIFNIITPLHRYGNLETLIKELAPESWRIVWHVITDRDCPFKITFTQDWIEHYICPNYESEFWKRCNHAINYFLSYDDLMPEEYYLFMNDDDGYELKFFEKLQEALEEADEPDVALVSMKRGQHTPAGVEPARAHGTETLIAAEENCKPGYVGVEQIVLKGRILAPCRLPLHVAGDGEMIQWICQNHKPVCFPEIYAYFNLLEPGRWD